MKHDEIRTELSRLVQLEADELAAYDAAVALVAPGPVRDELVLFRLEHQRHADALTSLFVQLRESPPEVEPDVKGVVIGALTPPRPPASETELLSALRGNEQLSGSIYAKALARPFPEAVLEFLRRARDEERRHLGWMERTLSRLGPWPAHAPP
jgi:rubrerythrin